MEQIRKYSFISNIIYAIKIVEKSNSKLLIIILIRPIANILNTLLWSYTPKYILVYIEDDVCINKIVYYIIIICLISMVLGIIGNMSHNIFDCEYNKTVGYAEKIRMEKLFSTSFKNIESPQFWDYTQRAKAALNWGKGLYGILYESRNFISQGVLMLISAALIGTQNIIVMIIFIVIAFSIAKILVYYTEVDKIKFSDSMTKTWRKINYLESTAKNFDFGKDIRLFNMSKTFKEKLKNLNKTFNFMNKAHHNRWIICNVNMELILLIQKILMYTWLVYNVVTDVYQISDFVLYVGLVTTFHNSVG